ncbi:LysE family translocator [Paracoccus shandongensis]|uniref:LysE family translocator n=1 Tax=Paracoccus shandongensis TaxID=2816048 RepID=UPI001F36425C|nr:LysE family translocator [Paracoccus shandongensis]
MTPGPNTFAVCWVASTGSRRDGLSAAAGVVTATGLWIGIALFGAGKVVAWNHQLFLGLRVVAALYLIWIGLRMLAAPAVPRKGLGGGQPFILGLLTALANPFSMAFWLGTFLAAIPATAPDHHYARIFALIILQSLLWYSSLAILFSTALRGRTFGTARLLRYVTAGAMIAVGASALVPA